MTTKDEVITAIEATEKRMKGLAQAILDHDEVMLADSEWDVRQALCHVAARANAVPLSNSIAERMLAAQAQGQPSILRGAGRGAEINQAQLDERNDQNVADLLNEIHAGHLAGIAAVREMPQDAFDQSFPRVTGDGEMTLGELILRAGSGHENEHMDQIVKAIESAGSD